MGWLRNQDRNNSVDETLRKVIYLLKWTGSLKNLEIFIKLLQA